MVIQSVSSFVLVGIDAMPCQVEVAISPGRLQGTTIVGLPDAAVRESIERVRAAVHNSGYRWPDGYLTINLAPANVRKEGPAYDLPIAVAVLMAGNTIEPEGQSRAQCLLMAGELALDGGIRGIRGAASMALLCRQKHADGVIVPQDNVREASLVATDRVHGASHLGEVVAFLNGRGQLRRPSPEHRPVPEKVSEDFAHIRGQEAAKRAMSVAAAGWHNVLLLGPPGTGKSMLSRCLCGILPPLTDEAAIEVLQIRSCVGLVGDHAPHVSHAAPFRSPHHSATTAAIIGGGSVPRPGEISLAHHGVLFLDELPEFSRAALESLRQPLEEHAVTIARAQGALRFPARCLLVAAMNPTRDGRSTARRGADAIDRLSAPFLDRIDLHVDVPPVPLACLRRSCSGRTTRQLSDAVAAARVRMDRRQGERPNGLLTGIELDELGSFEPEALDALEESIAQLNLSTRAWDRLRRVSRTIADLDDVATVQLHHVTEAVGYRSVSMTAC